MTRRCVPAFLLAGVSLCSTAVAQEAVAPASPPTDAAVVAAAHEVMTVARYCALITIGDGGQPQARIVDPFPPDESGDVWIATRPVTRKVAQIRSDPRVTLFYFDTEGLAYVTLIGRAELVDDAGMKAQHWNESWTPFYSDGPRGDDYLLIRVRPRRLEVVNPAHGMMGDPVTWLPASVELP